MSKIYLDFNGFTDDWTNEVLDTIHLIGADYEPIEEGKLYSPTYKEYIEITENDNIWLITCKTKDFDKIYSVILLLSKTNGLSIIN